MMLIVLVGVALVGVNCQTPAEPYVVFSSRGNLYKVDLNGSNFMPLEVANESTLVYSMAIDYDIRRNYLFWSDVLQRTIVQANLDGTQPRVLVDTGLKSTDGLAWDWLNEKLYWTDTNRVIEVYDILTGNRTTLINTGERSIPRGIILDPDTRYMYWTDWGQPAKIERASMDGTARETLHSTDLIWPNDITLDRQSQTIYWVDASLDKIESSHITGANRRLLTRDLILHPYSIVFYNGYLYWSDWGLRRVVVAPVGDISDKSALVPELIYDPTGVKVVALDSQPINSSNPCSAGNGGCSHLCLLAVSTGHSCHCPQGMQLHSNGTNCEFIVGETTTPVPIPQNPYVIFASKNTVNQVNLDGSNFIQIVNQTYAIAIDYDIRRNYLFWTDVLRRRIMRANLDGSQPQTLVDTGLNITDGLAWDWLNEKLYWTDTNRVIEVYDILTGNRTTLINTGERSIPRGIILDPDTRYMYWTDWGQPAKIERASMDGTARETLHSTGLIWPNDITLDRQSQTIYWIDANLDKIESSHITGANRRLLTRELILHPFSIVFYNGYLYWSDWGYDRVIRAPVRDIAEKFGLVPILPNDPTGVRVVALDVQPINSSNPCSAGNGGCSHMCLLAVSTGHSCHCPQGMQLASDGTNCEEIPPPPRIVNLTITSSSTDSEYFTGQRLSLTCSVNIQPEITSQALTASAEWTKSGPAIASSSRVTVRELVRVGPNLYQTSLVFHSLDATRGDEGNYTCSASINNVTSELLPTSTASASRIVEIPRMLFQVTLRGLSTDCITWRGSDTSAKDLDIMGAIRSYVSPRCGCDFTDDRITNRAFLCSPSSPHTVTYHGLLHGTQQASVTQLLAILKDWANSTTNIAVQFVPLSVERFCPVDSDSPLKPSYECFIELPTTPTTPVPTITTTVIVVDDKESRSQLDVITVTLWPIIAVVAVLMCAFIVAISIVALILRSRRSSQPNIPQNATDNLSNSGPTSVQSVKQNNQCPAYEFTVPLVNPWMQQVPLQSSASHVVTQNEVRINPAINS